MCKIPKLLKHDSVVTDIGRFVIPFVGKVRASKEASHTPVQFVGVRKRSWPKGRLVSHSCVSGSDFIVQAVTKRNNKHLNSSPNHVTAGKIR